MRRPTFLRSGRRRAVSNCMTLALSNEATVLSADLGPVPVEINRLDNQLLVRYYEAEWRRYEWGGGEEGRREKGRREKKKAGLLAAPPSAVATRRSVGAPVCGEVSTCWREPSRGWWKTRRRPPRRGSR